MKLSQVLAQHESFPSVEKALGFGYLLKNNPVFWLAHQKTLELGFRYSTQIDPNYLAFPMGQLEVILKNKTIPYLDNVTPLQTLNQNTALSLDWDHVVDNLRPNYLIHESCHAIARSEARATLTKNEKITLTLLEESFANTCEFLAMAWAQDPTHRLFLELNSYFTVFEDRTNLKNALEKYGRGPIFKMMLQCYLHCQFLNEDLNATDFKKIIELSGFKNTPEVKSLKSLAQNVFALNPRFRYTTTEMYLRLNGFKEGVTQALAFDYFPFLTEDSAVSTLFRSLSLFMETPHD